MTDAAIEAMNRAYRAEDKPSLNAQRAIQHALENGELSDDVRKDLVDELWAAIPEKKRGPYTGNPENGLASAFSRSEDSVTAHVSDLLFNQQPLGVILGDLHDHIRKRGTAIITNVEPRSEDVNEMMDMHHIAITIQPLPVWLARYTNSDTGINLPTS
ncbi:hypothetical protein [Salinibaculum rarum]|uniref:hypothetical protein n=1 Tax=Salinibaculum rarum TaxID=3058903 RepID=UPI00265F914E|nr:hypothetical protein [Salinibaculum sp. KK48]